MVEILFLETLLLWVVVMVLMLLLMALIQVVLVVAVMVTQVIQMEPLVHQVKAMLVEMALALQLTLGAVEEVAVLELLV
jgi:hypothetical protein